MKIIRPRRERFTRLALFSLVMIGLALLLPHTAHASSWIGFGAVPFIGSIVDAQLQFSAAQALTGTAVSTNVIDIAGIAPGPGGGATERRIGTGEPLAVVVFITVAAGGTTPTLQIDLQSDDNVGFASPAIVATSGSLAAAVLTAGAKIVIPIPPGKATEKFLRLNYTVGGTSPTVTVTAYLVPMSDLQQEQTYPKNFLISI